MGARHKVEECRFASHKLLDGQHMVHKHATPYARCATVRYGSLVGI